MNNHKKFLKLVENVRKRETLDKLDKETKEGEIVIVPGKILGKGQLNHKLTLAAFSFSSKALEKIKNSKIVQIEDLINKEFKIVS